MFNQGLMPRRFQKYAGMLVSAVVVCSITAMPFVFAGVHENTAAHEFPAAPEDKATSNPDEAPTGFNNSTVGLLFSSLCPTALRQLLRASRATPRDERPDRRAMPSTSPVRPSDITGQRGARTSAS